MKFKRSIVVLVFLLLLVALIFSAADQAQRDQSTATLWKPQNVTPLPVHPTMTPGWWGHLPIPDPSPTFTPEK